MLAFCINQSDKYLLCGVIDFTIPKVKNILNALIIKVVFSIIWEDNSATSLITCKKNKADFILSIYLSTYLINDNTQNIHQMLRVSDRE